MYKSYTCKSCTCLYTYIYIHIHIHIYIYIYTNVYIYIYTYVYIHTYTIQTHVQICIYTHKYISLHLSLSLFHRNQQGSLKGDPRAALKRAPEPLSSRIGCLSRRSERAQSRRRSCRPTQSGGAQQLPGRRSPASCFGVSNSHRSVGTRVYIEYLNVFHTQNICLHPKICTMGP